MLMYSVTYEQNGPKLYNRPVYCSQLYGNILFTIIFLLET